jgi:hypothetical protein
MADGTVGIVDQAVAGAANTKKVDTQEITRADGSVVEQQRMQPVTSAGDPLGADEITNTELLEVLKDCRSLLRLIALALTGDDEAVFGRL